MSSDALTCIVVFAAVILCIITNVLHMTLAALLGVSVLMVTGIMTQEVRNAGILAVYPINSLFIGSMVLIRCLEPTNVFPFLAERLFRLSRGDGRRLLALLFVGITPLCALFPNATVVLLMTPLCIEVSRLFRIQALPLILLLVFIANSSGLLTLVGGVPSYIVGNALKMDYLTYLREATPGGIAALAGLAVFSPVLFPAVWKARRAHTPSSGSSSARHQEIRNPLALAVLALILLAAILLFLCGGYLPTPISPVFTAIVAGTLALVAAQFLGLAHFGQIIRTIDWETILFFDCVFMIVASMETTGVFTAVGQMLSSLLGQNALLTALWLLGSLGVVSSVMPNIPLAAAMVPALTVYMMETDFLTHAQMTPGAAITGEPRTILLAMLFGVSLGGNATMIGAVPNIIAVTAARKAGEAITFGSFARVGIPVTLIQIGTYALYLLLTH